MRYRNELVLLSSARMDVASGEARSMVVDLSGCDAARLLLDVSEIGTPGGSDGITIYPIWIDSKDTEYIDANTTYGTIALVGTDTPVKKSVVIPDPAGLVGLKVVGGATLSSATGFIVSARLIKIPKLPGV